MKFTTLVLSSVALLSTAISAFQIPNAATPVLHQQRLTTATTAATAASSSSSPVALHMVAQMGMVDIREGVQRDVYTMVDWARNCGVQMAEGFEIGSSDGEDFSAHTNSPIAAGTSILFVPAGVIISSKNVEAEYGDSLKPAEAWLMEYEGTAQRLPLFRLMIKILVEYEKGSQSPWFPWLNALPRRFYNGAAMTDSCFECLPPYAASLAMNERNTYSRFLNALRKGLPISQETLQNDQIMKWAYNVALTRFDEVWVPQRAKMIAPVADMFNHATNPNVEVTYDNDGNAIATATSDIPAGSPLTISLGDPTNPTPLFAKYGFLYNDCTTIFCKALQLEKEIQDLGYDFKDLLFETQTGAISPKVWDIFLYKILENDPSTQQQFEFACKTNDEATKQGAHQHYFQYTLQAMKDHVDSVLSDIDTLTAKAQTYDLNQHPRVPMIVAHNNLVKDTFLKVQAQLYNMG